MNIQIPTEWLSPLSKEQQIAELNSEVRCTIKPSKIAGVGVFALRDIPKDDRCYIAPRMIPRFYNIPFGSLNKLFPEIKELVLARWASVVNGSLFCSPNDDAHLLMFVNHSIDPNHDVVSDTALKDIKKGEEVLENYCAMDNAEKAHYPWLKCDKNLWPAATNAEKPKSLRSLIDALLAKFRTKNSAHN